MKKMSAVLLFVIALLLVPVSVVLAQSDTIKIRLNRDFGYGGMGNEIQGTFSIIVEDEGPYARVTFMMDDVVLGEVTDAPYRWQFSTDSYPPGEHTYWAVAELADGTRLESNRITGFVLTKEESSQGLFKILGVMLGSMAVVGLISWVVSNSVSKKANQGQAFNGDGIPQGFTTMGGSVCPKCGKAFSFHFWKLNLLTHKVDRCPHCGKWVMVKSMTLQMMESALRAKGMTKTEPTVPVAQPQTEEERLKQQLDGSRFIDS
ncbi:MAG: hypothetical protein HPY85_11355 [Anaerolineae bacterium]|nr:hypothetical protein [Anaerolineae bacterium]